MKSKSQNYFMPKLKFKSFISNWGKVLLGELSTKVNQKNNDFFYDQVLTNSAIKGIVLQSDYFERAIVSEGNIDGYYIVKKDDFVYNPRISKNAPVGPISRNKLIDGVMSPLYTVFRVKNMNLDFIDYYFKSNHWHRYMKSVANYGARHDRMAISKKDFFKLPIPIPSIEEQNKIAEFLSSVDKKIQLLEKKKEQLEQYKKGAMQKIFSREIRFKDDNGNSYPDWDKKRLEELLDYEQPNKYIVESTAYNDEFNTPVLTAGKKFILGYTAELEGIFNNLPVIIFDDFTMSNKYVDFPFKVKSGAMKILKPKTSSINLRFIFELMQTINYASGEEHKRFWISEYSKIKINWPCIEEQKKIADFLSVIDKKIDTTSTQIDKTKEFKKGLLQQMFV